MSSQNRRGKPCHPQGWAIAFVLYGVEVQRKPLQTGQVLLPHLPDAVSVASPRILRGMLVWSQIRAHQQASKGGFI